MLVLHYRRRRSDFKYDKLLYKGLYQGALVICTKTTYFLRVILLETQKKKHEKHLLNNIYIRVFF